MNCRITISELYQRAYEIDPKKASDIKEMWEADMFTNRELVFGL